MAKRWMRESLGASRFIRSVQVEQDLREPPALNGYLVTAGARRALVRIVPAIQTDNAMRVWTLTGPYGTGKSALALFVANLLARDVVPGGPAAWKLLQTSDNELAQQLRSIKNRASFLPIAVTGAREPLQVASWRVLERLVAVCEVRVSRRLAPSLTST